MLHLLTAALLATSGAPAANDPGMIQLHAFNSHCKVVLERVAFDDGDFYKLIDEIVADNGYTPAQRGLLASHCMIYFSGAEGGIEIAKKRRGN